MGKLRLEAKNKSFLSRERYDSLLEELKNARAAAEDNNIFWDLEAKENPAQVRKEFLHVAEREQIAINIRRVRNENTLAFKFKNSEVPGSGDRGRMSADIARSRILAALGAAGQPMRKSEIVKETGISPSSWNLRIKELMDGGHVTRQGDRRDSVYCLP